MGKTKSNDLLTARNAEEADAIKRRQQEAQREIEANNRKCDEVQRKLFTAFMMWKACPHKRCIRAKACVGDVDECVRARWQPLVPVEMKAELQKIFKFIGAGMSPLDAVCAARKEMDEHDRIMAKMDARMAAQTTAPSPAPVAAPVRRSAPRATRAAPRIRGLV